MSDPTPMTTIEHHLVDIEQNTAQSITMRAEMLVQLGADLRHLQEVGAVQANPQAAQLQARLDGLTLELSALLRRECAAFATRYRKLPEFDKLDAFELELTEQRRKLELFLQLSPEVQSDSEVVRVEVQFTTLTERLQTARLIANLRRELQERWEAARGFDQTYPTEAIRVAKETRDQAIAFVDSKTAQTSEEISQVYQLRRAAEDFYDDLHQRHEIPTTKLAGNELVEMIIYFNELVASKPQSQVTYFATADVSAQPRSMLVSEARKIAQQRLLRLVWQKKVGEYTQSARSLLADNKPREAMAALQAWKELPGLNDDRLDMSLTGNIQAQITTMQAQIEPALERIRKAEEFLREAQRTLNPVKAQQYLVQAQSTYSHLPGFAEAQQRVLMQADEQFKQLVDDTQRMLASEDWDIVERRLAEAGELLAAFSRGLDINGQDRYNRARRVLDDVRDLRTAGRLAPADELDRLYVLRADYEDSYWPNWTRLQRRLASLAARGNVQDLKGRIQQACTVETSLLVLERLDQEINEVLAYPPVGMGESDLQELRSSRRKVHAWLGFARARDEMARLDRVDNTPRQGGLADVPDLQVMRLGIEQAQQDIDAAQAARSVRLTDRLGTLLRHDEEADIALKRLRNEILDHNLTLQAAERLRGEVDRWLNEVTSHRRELLELRRQLATIIVDTITNEAEQLLATARSSYFRNLNVAVIGRWVNSVKRLGLPMEDFLRMVKLPQRIAGIYTIESTARTRKDWEDVRTEWQAVVTVAREQEDERLAEYCTLCAAEAHRNSVLSEMQALRHDTSPASSQRLEALVRDPALTDDHRIWLEYGSFLFRRFKQEMSQTKGEHADVALAKQARFALERAMSLATINAEVGSPSAGPSVGSMLEELRGWEQMAFTLNILKRKLAVEDGRVSTADADEARRAFDERRRTLRDTEQVNLLELTWNRYMRSVRPVLERQERSSDLFVQLDGLLGLITLFPDDVQWPPRLNKRLFAAIRQFKSDVHEICDDPGAGKFLRRHAATDNRAFADAHILDAQRADVEGLAERLDALRLALTLLPPDAVSLADIRTISFDDQEQRIEEDRTLLQEARSALDQALRAAANGLLASDHFDRARYILRQTSQGSFQLAQIPEMFKDRGHPTYRDALNQLLELECRRRRQQQLKDDVDMCLQSYAHIAKAEQLPITAEGLNLATQALLAELREGLARPERPLYPLEVALLRLTQIAEEEPDDASGIHDAIKYDDPDEPGRTYRGLPAVRQVVGRKVAQIHAFHDLLAQINTLPVSGDLQCPGIVDWMPEKARLLIAYESNPEAYKAIYNNTKKIRNGDPQGLCEAGEPPTPRWSLQMAIRALERPEALRYANNRLEKAGYEPISATSLCAVARQLDYEREQRVELLRSNLQDSMAFERELSRRWSQFQFVLDRFLQSYHRIANRKSGQVNSRDSMEYFAVADELYALFPCWPDFLDRVEEVVRRHPNLRPRWFER